MTATISPLVSRLAAVGLALAALLALLLMLEPIVQRVAMLDSRIELEREQIARLTAIGEAAKGAGSASERSRQTTAAAYLPGETEAVQLGNLQTAFRTVSAKAGVRHQSTRTLPTVRRDGFQLVGVHASTQIGIEALQRLLRGIETHRPVLIVDGLDVAPVRGALPGSPEERQLQVEIKVVAIARAVAAGGDP
jgi:hypothetical protein